MLHQCYLPHSPDALDHLDSIALCRGTVVAVDQSLAFGLGTFISTDNSCRATVQLCPEDVSRTVPVKSKYLASTCTVLVPDCGRAGSVIVHAEM